MLLDLKIYCMYNTRGRLQYHTVLHTKRKELSYFDILWIFSCNELFTNETYHHDPQPLPVNLITIT